MRANLSKGFRERVAGREVDLLAAIDEGELKIEYLSGAEGIFARGRRHLIAAPHKSGKSLTTQIQIMHMVQAGTKALVLDRENAKWVYASRLKMMLDAWGDSAKIRKAVKSNYHYVEFPHLNESDGPELAAWAQATGVDLVVFDSQRMFLTDQGLNENKADDYSKFMAASIDPLFEAGIATLVLDNTGHKDGGRSRGTSAKLDLHEIIFTLKTVEPFSAEQRGRAKLTLAPGKSRLGNHGEWTMEVGEGAYECWRALSTTGSGSLRKSAAPEGAELVLAYIEKHPGCNQTEAVQGCMNNDLGRAKLERAVKKLVKDGLLARDGRSLHVAG